ncbi:hypothetical protein B0H13DRAFT_1850209 [Mycena leptocephala]|nr:hypothetical protein B0H13DRAFT_1850209 [Mycena leptocephala]
MCGRVVYQGDSLGWDPDCAMLIKLRWLLGDVMESQGGWTEGSLSVPHQGAGSGSCGIVATSTIARFVDPELPEWTIASAATDGDLDSSDHSPKVPPVVISDSSDSNTSFESNFANPTQPSFGPTRCPL